MSDPYQTHARGLSSPGARHAAVTPNDAADLVPRPRVLFVLTSGTLALMDETATVLAYPVSAGQVLPFSAVRVMQTGTTATCVGWT